MSHPTREEWMSYLYDESSGEHRANLAAHLAVCQECQGNVDIWRSAMRDLDNWSLQSVLSKARGHRVLLRWAAAAAIVLGLGFGFGRLSAPASVSVEQVRAALEPSLRQQLRKEFAVQIQDELERSSRATLAASGAQTRELMSDFAKTAEQNRTDDNRLVSEAIEKLDAQRIADHMSLKRDLDTVAVYSEAGLLQTRQQMVQLAGYRAPDTDPSTLPQN
jgi:hypothetical protein